MVQNTVVINKLPTGEQWTQRVNTCILNVNKKSRQYNHQNCLLCSFFLTRKFLSVNVHFQLNKTAWHRKFSVIKLPAVTTQLCNTLFPLLWSFTHDSCNCIKMAILSSGTTDLLLYRMNESIIQPVTASDENKSFTHTHCVCIWISVCVCVF